MASKVCVPKLTNRLYQLTPSGFLYCIHSQNLLVILYLGSLIVKVYEPILILITHAYSDPLRTQTFVTFSLSQKPGYRLINRAQT